MARKQNDRETVRRYLLDQLSDVEQQDIELRLLSDDSFAQEFEIVEDEIIDEFLAGEVSRDERVKIEQHFLTHPDRQSKLKSAQAFKRYFGKIPPDPVPTRTVIGRLSAWLNQNVIARPVPAGIAVLLVAVVGLIIWRVTVPNDLQKGLTALNQAYRQQRPVEARVSELDYAPFLNTRRGELQPVDALQLNRAQRFLLDAEQERADAASYHALGKLFLLQKDAGKAIEYLERAAKGNTDNAQLYSDLGAAYLEKAKQELEASNQSTASGQAIEDLARSLEYLNRSLEINPNLLEALFNRGLVHQYQSLDHEAETDWKAYLEKDPGSQWAAEARQKLKLLEEKKTRRAQTPSPQVEDFLRAYQASDAAAAWAIYRRNHARGGNAVTKALVNAVLTGNADNKTENLRALDYLGQLELRKVEDAFTADLAKVYSSANTQSQPLLVQAREQLNKGYELFSEAKNGEAIELFESARDNFEKAGDLPESLIAEAAIAQAAAVEPNIDKAQKTVARIVPICESKHYKWLLADALVRRAHIQSTLNNYSDAVIDASRALQLFQELNDLGSTLTSFTQLATLHLLLNDKEKSFSFLRQAMDVARDEATPRQLWGLHLGVSLNLSALQLYRAALDYQNESLHLVLTSEKPSPLNISRSYQYIGLTYGSLGRFDLAVANIRNAYEQGKSLAAERNGQSMMANASLKLGDVYRYFGDQSNALNAYDESLRLYDGLEFFHYSYAAHKGKFLSYRAQNQDVMASQELQIVLQLFDEYREKIRGERQTSFFFNKEQDTYDLAIDFAYSRMHDEQRAYEYSETCRARNLRELIQHGAETTQSAAGLDLRSGRTEESQITAPLTSTQIKAQLPEQVQVVQYAVLEKKLLIWHVTRTSEIFAKSIDIDSSKLTEIVANTVRQIRQQDESGASQSLKTLYNLLVEPIKDRLNSDMVICFVPDKDLHFVPFTALLSGNSGRYLGQDYRVMVSPSTTILIDSTNEALTREKVKDERLLAVGNPRFDRTTNPKLTNLTGAEREVEGIASYYRGPRVLTGGAATRTSVINELARADVAHFAAHYQIDTGSLLASRLLLAPEPGDRAHSQPSALHSGDIYRMNLARTRLVFLSACDTGIEQQFGGEGPVGFARSFLVAGVPVVVASLWAVDSDATSQLMIEVHRLRRHENRSTTQALMLAQQQLISSENYGKPYYWAGFTVIGGYSTF
ncbi:MAG TPA: CHAT domain-containing protein [Pyrinomonadaceae bacterium]|nr:CHAT domain-containing protein [Pyrinomonadaceae bacterium]